MSVPSPLPSTDPRAAAGSLALQVAASMLPVPLPWLYVAMGVGCAVFVHSEVDMCGKRKRHLARARAISKKRATDQEQQQQHQQQEEESFKCWASRWCSPSSTSSAKPNNSTQHPPTNAPEAVPADQFCLVRTIQGCLNHRRSRQEIGTADESWVVAQQPNAAVASSSSSSSTIDSSSRLLPTSAARTADEVDEELASAVLPQASHLSSAMDHLRFKLDSLLVWKRSFQSQLVECMPPATDPDAPASSASSTAAAAGVAANVADLHI